MSNRVTVRPKLQLELGAQVRVGIERIRLLEAIAEQGSISGGARALGLSYRGAYDAVLALNALFGRPIVAGEVGGREGGRAVVTSAGQALIVAFRRIDDELAHVVGQLEQHLADETEPLDRLAWRLGMKTSARNQLSGVVARVTPGAVNTEVVLNIGGALEVVATITKGSAEALELAPGRAALALIKASFVILATGDTPLRTSARNVFSGRVVEHCAGVVSDEVVLEVPGGVRITATVTRESGEALGLEVGVPAQALIKSSHVIVAVE